MAVFVDQMLLQLSDPPQLVQLLVPPGDPAGTRMRLLLSAMYELEFANIHDIRDVEVHRLEVQRPLFPPAYTRGTWTQTVPSHVRTDVVYEALDGVQSVWLDISAEVGLTLVLEVDTGEVESILTQRIDEFNTLDEFRAHFRFIDLDAFMAKHDISSVEELRERFQYLLTRIRLRALEPFDPNDPATQHLYTLHVAILIRDTLDLAAALRDAKLVRTAGQRALTYHRQVNAAEVHAPFAPVLIFPESALAGGPFTADALQTFFGREQILALFVTPV